MGSYEVLRGHHKKAFEHISEALKIDEESKTLSKKHTAIEHYKLGIAELSKGIEVSLDQIEGDKIDRAQQLRDKMITNMDMARDRLRVLETSKPPVPKAPSRVPNGNRKPNIASSRSLSPKPKPKPKPLAEKQKDEVANRIKRSKVDPKLGHIILDQVLESNPTVGFEDVCGHASAKQALNEAVILPALNPSVFTGLRRPVQGILLFGPPGNGKTMLAKAVAREANSTFFNISASALTSKWVGEAEKLVKALFTLARDLQPAVVFIDEIDSILCTRSEKDNEVSRRLKTEFLLQFDGVGSSTEDRILVMGATNRPFELDDAAIRRFPKRIYIGLPDASGRGALLKHLLSKQSTSLNRWDLDYVVGLTDGYSNSDLTQLASEAAMGPIRDLSANTIRTIKSEQLRPMNRQDFDQGIKKIRPSVKPEHLKELHKFAKNYGEI